jgi:hypothetical protein
LRKCSEKPNLKGEFMNILTSKIDEIAEEFQTINPMISLALDKVSDQIEKMAIELPGLTWQEQEKLQKDWLSIQKETQQICDAFDNMDQFGKGEEESALEGIKNAVKLFNELKPIHSKLSIN